MQPATIQVYVKVVKVCIFRSTFTFISNDMLCCVTVANSFRFFCLYTCFSYIIFVTLRKIRDSHFQRQDSGRLLKYRTHQGKIQMIVPIGQGKTK